MKDEVKLNSSPSCTLFFICSKVPVKPTYLPDYQTKKHTDKYHTYHLWISTMTDPARNEFQCFLLNSPHALYQRLLCDIFTICCNSNGNILTDHFVDIQHVEINSTQLNRCTYNATSCSLHIYVAAKTKSIALKYQANQAHKWVKSTNTSSHKSWITD